MAHESQPAGRPVASRDSRDPSKQTEGPGLSPPVVDSAEGAPPGTYPPFPSPSPALRAAAVGPAADSLVDWSHLSRVGGPSVQEGVKEGIVDGLAASARGNSAYQKELQTAYGYTRRRSCSKVYQG